MNGANIEKIGDYTIIAHLGHGAMGSVEKAESPDGKIVAIKTLFPQFAYDSEYVKRFKREAEIAKKLSHPNVVKILEVGDDTSSSVPRPYIVMEYVTGRNLAEVMHDPGMVTSGVKQSSSIRKNHANVKAENVERDCKSFTPCQCALILAGF